ncbi:lipopolysaccharide biosynthesis protein RfbH [Candidatus Micrarchaeota archaeon]|nr:lipopolysaccharide biosynthesis protein RfbH [Candidatus Micrarchaeota archaeon]MBU1930513.1 lipopolysaccharide biosynthesis protein RfbH [Candidatus Micrarchaeota archaeon]
MDEEEIQKQIFALVKELYHERSKQKKFIPGKSRVLFSGDIFDEREMVARVKAVLPEWITLGPRDVEFTEAFSKFMGVKHTLVTNSGSSANLIAVSALCSKNFPNRLRKGDEIITPACTFPTTLSPIILNNLMPVFLDVELGTYNINAQSLEKAISNKTKAMFIPHTLGNPNEMDVIMETCERHNIILLEDNCDSLDSTYGGKRTGSFGLIGTSSFYPAHHLSMGEGGAAYTNDLKIYRLMLSLRNWGRGCYCALNEKNPQGACNARFDYKVKGVPYDHKYLYTNIGFNLKPLDLQPAVGIEQLKKQPDFTEKRKKNFKRMYKIFERFEEFFILPYALPKSDPSWFAFPLTIKPEAGFERKDFTLFMEQNLIDTRHLFAGNILQHPAYEGIECRVAEKLDNADLIFSNSLFMGVYPGLFEAHFEYIESKVEEFFRNNKSAKLK